MADAYEVRKRLLELDAADIGLIAAIPVLGGAWARRANAKPGDLAKGGQRALKGLRAAIMRDATGFATDLARIWDNVVNVQLELVPDEADPTLLGVRIAAAIIGTSGARALVGCLAAADFDVSSEMVDRFDELSAAADHPLLEEETESLIAAASQDLPTEVRDKVEALAEPSVSPRDAELSSLAGEGSADSMHAQSVLDAVAAQALIERLREEADQLADALSALSADITAGKVVPDIQHDIRTWNASLSHAWSELGGPDAAEAVSFKSMESLRERIIERESASAAAELAREEKRAELAQLRQGAAALKPLIDTNKAFLAAYEEACAKIAVLENELGTMIGDVSTADGAPTYTEHIADEGTAQASADSTRNCSERESADTAPEAFGDTAPPDNVRAVYDTAGGRHGLDGWGEDGNIDETADRKQEHRAPSDTVRPETQMPTADLDRSESSDVGSASDPTTHEHVTDDQVSVSDDEPSPDDHPTGVDINNELTFHVDAGRFGAAWLVASAARLPEHEVKAYRHAAGAFGSGPGGIDPAEVLIGLTTTVAEDSHFSCQSARVALAATLRATLVAGWSPRSELEIMAGQANLEPAMRDLVSAVIAAADRNYQHLSDFNGDLTRSLAAVHEKALEVRTELDSMRIKFNRADKVLKYLLRVDQPLGAALGAVLADTNGVERHNALTRMLAALESPDGVIETADAAVSTHLQRRKPIESHARMRLRRAIETVAECVADALNAAVVVADDSRTAVVQEVRKSVIAATQATASIGEAAGPGDAALARLVGWIMEPNPANRVGDELQLLLDESLPVVSAERDLNGLPIIDADCASEVVAELHSPGGWQTLFDAYAARGDLQEAYAVARHAPELQERMPTLRTDWKRRLEREVSAARADLARTFADGTTHGPQADNPQVDAEAQLVAPGEYSGDRYDLQMADLRRLRAEFAEHRSRTAEHLRDRANDEVANHSDRSRILALIADEDFVGTNELLALARSGTLPSLNLDQGSVGSELFDAFVESLSSLDDASTPSVQELVATFAAGRLDEVGKTDQARLASWGDLVPRRGHPRSRQGALFAVLRALGLDTRGEPMRQTSPGVRHFDSFRVNATPVDGSLVPGLGSQATHYMVVVTADHKLLRETLSSGFPAKNGPNIVLFDGMLTMDQRRQCLTVCREKKISAIVVDHAVAAFVAARHPRSFRAVQQLTLPFTCFTHYTVVAGNVPDEVFVGRNDQLTQLTDRAGSLFVYGGRQLGKSALLRKIERDFNQVPDHHAIFIDLNSHGIGTWADPQQLWPTLYNELAKIGSMGAKANSVVRNHDVVIKTIRQWLDGKESRRLLLLLDEADAFLEKESRGEPSGFRNIGPLKGLFDDTQGRFKPVFAGLHKVQRLQNIANTPLAHGGRDVLIGPLTAKPARDLVVKPLEALGYRFDNPEAVWRLLAFTNLQAGLIQVVCNDLVSHLQARPLRRGEPLIAITDTDIDHVTGHETTRSKIAEKLRLTIALEDRYRVIALAVAIMSMEDNFREKYAATDIREHCEVYWPQGFEDLNSAEFEVYLDELIGLGVLTKDRENLFAVRSPNIVTMLGSKEQLETELEENREQFELPHEYNPRSTRRQVTTDGQVVRSPLSEHDLSHLIPVQKKYQPRDFVIVGGEALGVSDVAPVLSQVGAERRAEVTVLDPARADIASALSEFKWAGGGASAPRVVVVDGSRMEALSAAAVVAAVELVRKRRHGHLVMVLGPDSLGIVAATREHWSATNTRLITLEKWSGDGIRSWRDNPFSTPADRRELLRYSGGWPHLVEQAVVDVSNRNVSYAEEWDRLSKYPENVETAAAFLRSVGVGDKELKLLTAWAQLDATTYERIEDIAAVLDRDIDEVRGAATNLTLLGALNEQHGEFLIDPVVVRAVTTIV